MRHCYAANIVKDSFFNDNTLAASLGVLSLSCSVLLIVRKANFVRASKSLPLGEEGTTVLFLHRAPISSIDQLKTIGDICLCVFLVFVVSFHSFNLFSVDSSL